MLFQTGAGFPSPTMEVSITGPERGDFGNGLWHQWAIL
jgi:hypothetical protein